MTVKFILHKKKLCCRVSILQDVCPCFPATTVLGHMVVARLLPMARLSRNVEEELAHDCMKTH